MAASSFWSWSLKEEPASPLRLFEQEEWYNESDNVAVEVVVDEAKQSRGEAASKLLQDLDQWLKDEDPFPQWMENTTEFQIFEDLPLPLVPMSSQDVVAPLKTSVPFVTPALSPALGSLNTPPAPVTVPIKTSTPPAFSRVEVVAVKPLQNQTYITLNPGVQCVTQSPPVVSELTPTGLEEFSYPFTPLGTLTPPESPHREDSEEVAQSPEVVVFQQLQPHELDELVNMRAECWVESPEASFSSNSSFNGESEPAMSPCSASSCSDPDWVMDTSYEVVNIKTPKRKRATKPYTKPALEEKRLRKKEQNKNAATRYRLKKKQEQDSFLGEEKQLQDRNGELKNELTEVQREIKYLKSLIKDLFKAKGLTE